MPKHSTTFSDFFQLQGALQNIQMTCTQSTPTQKLPSDRGQLLQQRSIPTALAPCIQTPRAMEWKCPAFWGCVFQPWSSPKVPGRNYYLTRPSVQQLCFLMQRVIYMVEWLIQMFSKNRKRNWVSVYLFPHTSNPSAGKDCPFPQGRNM